MDYKSKIVAEVEALPESLLPELLNYVQNLKSQSATKSTAKPKLSLKSKLPTKPVTSGDTIIIYTDGACTGNPGKGGYGAVIIDGDRRQELAEGYQLTTNNRMEMMGAIAALESLKSNSRVKLHTDSKYIVDAVNKGWAKKWQSQGWR
ncbi:MAG: ribonuclease H, partial [Cyanobacteria bacterium J06635_13]